MTPDLARAVFDELLPGWRDAKRVGHNRELRAPYRKDNHPSLHVHEDDGVWIDRATGEGGGALDFARKMLGEDGARDLLARLQANGKERPQAEHTRHNGSRVACHELEVISEPSSPQIAALKRSRRLKDAETLHRIGAKLVRARFRKDEASSWGPWDEWLGFPALSDSWKLWALNRNGVPRLNAKGKLIRCNAGPVSLILSPLLRDASPGSVSLLLDVEGESDFLAALEAGLSYVLTSTGGAGSLGAYVANAAWLRALHISEVIVLGDRDEAGQRGAEKRAEWWLRLGVSVRVPALPEALGDGGDLRDYLCGRPARNGNHSTDPLGNAAALSTLANAAPLQEPRRALEVDEGDEDQEGDELDSAEDAERGVLDLPSIALRGSFRAFIDYLRSMTGASPAHGFASLWTVLGASIGPARWGTWSGRVVPIVYALTCGPTGDHKTTAMDAAAELLPEGIGHVSGSTSDAGLFDALEASEGRPVLLHFDELGFLLKMAALSGSTLDGMLNRLWGSPAYLDRNLSKRNKDGGARRLERPFVCLLGGTHPETFWLTLGDDRLAIAGGFVNRLAVFAAETGRSLPRTAAPDETAARALRAHLAKLSRLEPALVELAPNAEPLWDEFAQDHDARIQGLSVVLASVTKRVRDHVARLALIYATDAGRTQVSAADLAAAIEVGAYLEQSYRGLLAGRQADRGPARASDLEAIARRLLTKHPGVWQTARSILRTWPNARRPSSDELRRILRAVDGVEVDRARRHERYRLATRQGGPTRHTTLNPAESKAVGAVCRVGGSPVPSEAFLRRMRERYSTELADPEPSLSVLGDPEEVLEARQQIGAVLIRSPRFGEVWVALEPSMLAELVAVEEAGRADPRPVLLAEDVARLRDKSDEAIRSTLAVLATFPGARLVQ